jgi:hypothetical protein
MPQQIWRINERPERVSETEYGHLFAGKRKELSLDSRAVGVNHDRTSLFDVGKISPYFVARHEFPRFTRLNHRLQN